MLYIDKSKEELEAKLELFISSQDQIFGQISIDELKLNLQNLIEKRKLDRFLSTFETTTPTDLIKLLDLLEAPKKKVVNNAKGKKSKSSLDKLATE